MQPTAHLFSFHLNFCFPVMWACHTQPGIQHEIVYRYLKLWSRRHTLFVLEVDPSNWCIELPERLSSSNLLTHFHVKSVPDLKEEISLGSAKVLVRVTGKPPKVLLFNMIVQSDTSQDGWHVIQVPDDWLLVILNKLMK